MPRPVLLPLNGATAVVTGAASGIGAALAVQLAARGCHLALVDVNAAGLDATAQAARGHGVHVSVHVHDLALPAVAPRLLDEVQDVHAQVQVLVNNAGVALGGAFQQVTADDFDWLMAVNFGAVVRLTRAFLPLLQRQPAAQVVNVSSIFGIVAPPGQTAYCAAKFAVRGFSESLRHELAHAGSPVGVTVVHPGGVRTAIADNARHADGLDPADVEAQRRVWQRLLKMPAEQAAARLLQGIERREPRVLIGDDAVRAAWLQRLAPVRYWSVMARDIARRVGRNGSAEARP